MPVYSTTPPPSSRCSHDATFSAAPPGIAAMGSGETVLVPQVGRSASGPACTSTNASPTTSMRCGGDGGDDMVEKVP